MKKDSFFLNDSRTDFIYPLPGEKANAFVIALKNNIRRNLFSPYFLKAPLLYWPKERVTQMHSVLVSQIVSLIHFC